MRPLSLYIHIPWCKNKCCYCAFYSEVATSESLYTLERAYLQCLINELSANIKELNLEEFCLQTIFFGGGTPSLLSSHFYNTLLAHIFNSFFLDRNIEVTIEANPRDINLQMCESWAGCGINRISIGVQSLNNQSLNALGRDHSCEDVYRAIECIQTSGLYENTSADLIFSIPGQSLENWRRDLETITLLPFSHISVYGLKVEEGTALSERLLSKTAHLPTEDEYVEMYQCAQEILPHAGFMQYEISNYAKKGKECQHNLAYWRNKDYLGLGSAAHSHVRGIRWSFDRSTADFCHAFSRSFQGESLGSLYCIEDTASENELKDTIMMGLRLVDGIDCNDIQALFNYDLLKERQVQIAELCDWQLLEVQGSRLVITPTGYLVSNAIIARLIANLS